MFDSIGAIALGFLLDALFGDPEGMPHPIRLIGGLITVLEKPLRAVFPKSQYGKRAAGTILAVTVILLSAGAAWGILFFAGLISRWAAFALESVMCYYLIAAKALCVESGKVSAALEQRDLPAARNAVSMIVGRDTWALSERGVTKAAVETIAENTSDGVIAPLFFLALGGAPLGFFYKAVNTLDSMIGYQNERYLDFGRFAAKFDDLLNWIPARLSALLMIAAAGLSGFDTRGAARIWRRDRRNHLSPNSAQTESVCAGALGVRLAGDAYYGGKLVQKPAIGDALRPVEPMDIHRTNRLMYVSSALALILFLAAKTLIIFLI